MSERQAKKTRKETPVTIKQKKPADKGNVLFNVIAAVIIVAVAALAGFTIWQANAPEVTTFAQSLEDQDKDFDTAVAEWGLDPEVFSPEMPAEDAAMLYTLENMAKMDSKEVADYITELGLPADVATNVPAKDLPVSVMLKVSGLEMTVEDLREFGLSEKITADTLWSEAQEDVINAVYSSLLVQQQNAQSEADAAGEGEAPAAETETPAEGEATAEGAE